MFFERSVGLFTLFLIGLLALAACGGGDSDKAAEHYVKGTVYTTAGPWENAIKEFDESIRLDPKAADATTTVAPFTQSLTSSKKPSAITTKASGLNLTSQMAITAGPLRMVT